MAEQAFSRSGIGERREPRSLRDVSFRRQSGLPLCVEVLLTGGALEVLLMGGALRAPGPARDTLAASCRLAAIKVSSRNGASR